MKLQHINSASHHDKLPQYRRSSYIYYYIWVLICTLENGQAFRNVIPTRKQDPFFRYINRPFIFPGRSLNEYSPVAQRWGPCHKDSRKGLLPHRWLVKELARVPNRLNNISGRSSDKKHNACFAVGLGLIAVFPFVCVISNLDQMCLTTEREVRRMTS